MNGPAALTLATACPLIGQGGDEAIAGWLDRNHGARMVVIDVFAKIRGAAPLGASAYEADYAAVGAVKRLADAYAVPFVLVHHVRKAGSEDFLAEVPRTNAHRAPRGSHDGDDGGGLPSRATSGHHGGSRDHRQGVRVEVRLV